MKRGGRFSAVTFIVSLLSMAIVYADTMDLVTSRLRWIFFDLPGSTSFIVWLKFAFFVILFAALYNAGIQALGAKGPLQRALAVFAFIISLISAIFVPQNLLLYIFKMYYVILVVLFALLPSLIGFLINRSLLAGNSRTVRVLRAFVYLLIAVFIFGLIGQLQANSSPDTELFMQVLEPLQWGAIIAIIAAILNIFLALGGENLASKVPAAVKTIAGEKAKEEKPKPEGDAPAQPGGDTPSDGGTRGDPSQVPALQGEMHRFMTQAEGFQRDFQAIHNEINAAPHTVVDNVPRLAPEVATPFLVRLQRLQPMIDQNRHLLQTIIANEQFQNVSEHDRAAFHRAVVIFLRTEQQYVDRVFYIARETENRPAPNPEPDPDEEPTVIDPTGPQGGGN